MTFSREIQCHSCGKRETLRTALIYHYVLRNDTRLVATAIPVWCFECDGVRDAERLPELERVAGRLSDLEENGINTQELAEKAAFLNIDIDPQEAYAKEHARLTAGVDWRSNRITPPRCLDCGSVNHLPAEWSGDGLEHPGCGGAFMVILEFHSVQSEYIEVDGDGKRLRN